MFDANVGSSQEEGKRLKEIIYQDNLACEESSNIIANEFQGLLDSLTNWLGLSQVAFAISFLVVVGFLLEKGRVSLDNEDMNQLFNFWGVMISHLGCKKRIFSKTCQRT